jgi:serine/threonine protein kinase
MSGDDPLASNLSPPPEEPVFLFTRGGLRYEALRPLTAERNELLARRRFRGGPSGLVRIKRLVAPCDPKLRQRLLDEVRLAMRLHHPAISPVYLLTLHEGVPHVVMEYVEGFSLETLLGFAAVRDRPLSMAFALYLGAEVADALHYAHTLADDEGRPLGIVHRGVNPERIRVGHGGEVKLTDFGEAWSRLAHRRRTSPWVLRGDIAYASPEYTRSESVDARADIFSLGLVLLELLTHRHPLDSEEMEALSPEKPEEALGEWVECVRSEEPSWLPAAQLVARLQRLGPEHVERAAQGLPEALKAVLHKALRHDPAERFQTAAELREALRRQLAQAGPYGREEAARELHQAAEEASHRSESAEVLEQV